MSALEQVQDALRAAGKRREGPHGWQCPAHDDAHPSLSVKAGDRQPVVLHCQVGCSPDQVLAALGLTWRDVLAEETSDGDDWTPHGPATATYRYVDEDGRLLFGVCRTLGKQFPQWRPDPAKPHGRAWNLNGVRRVLYRLPAVLEAVQAGRTVYVAEGEKDAHALEAAGVVATCNPGGAGKWRDEYAEALAGASVVVVVDRDQAGRRHAAEVAASLCLAGCTVRVVEAAEGKDASDHLAAGHGLDELVPAQGINSAVATAPPDASPQVTDSFVDSFDSWPTLGEDAFHGLAGKAVRALAPHTEADPSALLAEFLAMFGNLVGPAPHAVADAAEHPARLNPLIIGETSRARKGSAHANLERLFERVDPDWLAQQASGLVSGEGLIEQVRDGAGEDDLGVADKRLLVVEGEFARVLIAAGRQGSILSPTIRDAYDGRPLRSMARGRNALKATGHHVTVVGHTTVEELHRRLTETETVNGFANRFLLVCARRSKLLPFGGAPDPATLDDLADEVVLAVKRALPVGLMHRSPEADKVWEAAYRRWAADTTGGLVGALTARSEAHALRLSVAYALLDGTATIGPEHVRAAVAVVDYSAASARRVFGEQLGDDVADQLLAGLREAWPAELDGTEQHDLFGRNTTGGRLALARQALERAGLAATRSESTGGPGRPRLRTRALPGRGWRPAARKSDEPNESTNESLTSENGARPVAPAAELIPDGGEQGQVLDSAAYKDPSEFRQ